MIRTIWVLGEKLLGVADNNQIMTLSQFKKFYERSAGKNDGFVVRFGQGLGLQGIEEIKTLLRNHNEYDQIMKINQFYKDDDYLHVAHNSYLKNVMIGNLKQVVSENIYFANLLLDDECDEMRDRIAGKHAQSMIMLEAARQLVNSVAENYLIKDKEIIYDFIVNSVVSTFHNYMSSFSVELYLTIYSINKIFKSNMDCKVSVDFYQSNQKVCELIFDFSVYSKHYLESMEKRVA